MQAGKYREETRCRLADIECGIGAAYRIAAVVLDALC
jgi:hypothetical protein